MTKELGDVTLRELAEECERNEDCYTCPLDKTMLNCWNAKKMLEIDNGDLLDTEVDI